MKDINRRSFMNMATCGAMGSLTLFNTLFNLKTMNAASIANSSVYLGGGYKALVCIYLSGGNDSYNMLIPKGNNAEYNDYADSRSIHAIPQNDILSLNGSDYGLHPIMTNVQGLFNDNNLAFVANVGTLIEPIQDRTVMENVNVPLGLYSHADQSQQWQTSVPHDRTAVGWGGKVSDLLMDMNSNDDISMNISLAGSNVFQTGNTTTEFALNPYADNGAITLNGYGQPWLFSEMLTQGVDNMVEASYQDAFKKSYVDVVKVSRDANIQYSEAMEGVTLNTVFSDNFLSMNMSLVARSLAIRDTIGMTRQIFFVDIGGWDMHDELNASHEEGLEYVDSALGEFYTALEELGIADCVTTFVMSEFARTLTSNGNGTDHGWGGNAIIMGEHVNGGQIFGNYPSLKLTDWSGDSNDNLLDVGGGVLIPTTSCDEYFAELALWFGVSASELSTIFPNIGNFYDTGSSSMPLGFL